jgi:hypothetical protein
MKRSELVERQFLLEISHQNIERICLAPLVSYLIISRFSQILARVS